MWRYSLIAKSFSTDSYQGKWEGWFAFRLLERRCLWETSVRSEEQSNCELHNRARCRKYIRYARVSSESANKFLLEYVRNVCFVLYSVHFEERLKLVTPFEKMRIAQLHQRLKSFANSNKITLEKRTASMQAREKQTVTRTFHRAGIVVPYNKKTQLGYRDLAVTDSKLPSNNRPNKFTMIHKVIHQLHCRWATEIADTNRKRFDVGSKEDVDIETRGGVTIGNDRGRRVRFRHGSRVRPWSVFQRCSLRRKQSAKSIVTCLQPSAKTAIPRNSQVPFKRQKEELGSECCSI